MRVLLTCDQIQARIDEMGKQIAADYNGREPHLVGVLKGACPFMTDLAQAIDLDHAAAVSTLRAVCGYL